MSDLDRFKRLSDLQSKYRDEIAFLDRVIAYHQARIDELNQHVDDIERELIEIERDYQN